jgi:hypothetical protein
MRIRTVELPIASFRLRIAVAAGAAALALFAIPHQANAQGVFGGMERGANQGAYEGHRAAGPVGGAIGGAIGAGVGGAVGGVNGVLGNNGRDDVAYCQQRFRSYDVGSGTYLGHDGRRYRCP